METWQKVVGGAACGIVCMVALPVIAPCGAITAIGALIGASLGGGAAYAASEDDAPVTETGGYCRAKAEYDVKLQEFIAALQRSTGHTLAQTHYFDVMLALIGVGMACAGARAPDSAMAMSVKEFAAGQALAFLPSPILHMIDTTVASPPTLKTAYLRALKVAAGDLALFDEMVYLVEMLDASTKSSNQSVPSVIWRQLRAA
ncbi:hypothetical protein [Janthinobacterium sp. BJB304]|uniref:hypothetical protein n=1 Tax=Janthinobacterium sp. BJB304 TaxID=1572871 RepID=UPI000C0D7E02|nr:hypothetical protein [Janthinobacterium sp. BJB304]PHV36908.1 hypothetical protein CSQ95_21895 [Janthinobacterium sp. BJB304]